MTDIQLEHVNITVSNPETTAKMLCELFDWHIRWSGPSKMGGHTIHVGTHNNYIAVYTHEQTKQPGENNDSVAGGLNHIGLTVADLDAIEKRVNDAGFKPYNHGDYEPGRRFYFNDHDDIEYEIVSYG